MSDSAADQPKAKVEGTREEHLARSREHLAEVKKQYPDLDIDKATEQFIKPSIDFGFTLQEQLDPETNAKLNELIKGIFFSDAGAIKDTKAEIKALLAGREDLWRMVDAAIFAREDALVQAQDYVRQQQAEGKQAFPTLEPPAKTGE